MSSWHRQKLESWLAERKFIKGSRRLVLHQSKAPKVKGHMNKHNPVFSIVIATYNRAHLVTRAVNSVLAQTFSDFELIIVDDASTDQTPEVMANISDPRVEYLRLEQNGGVSVARNAGIRRAKGTFITLLDDDDASLPELLENIYRVMNSVGEEIGFTWCWGLWVQDTEHGEVMIGERVWNHTYATPTQARAWFATKVSTATSYGVTVRSSCFRQIGLFDENMRYAVDTELFIRLTRRFGYAIIPKHLVKIYKHAGAKLNRPSPARAEACEYLIKQHREFYDARRRASWEMHRGTAGIYYQAGQRDRGRKLMLQFAARNLFWWRTWKSLLCLELFGTEKIGIRRLIPISLPRV